MNAESLSVAFENNTLLRSLLGEHDRNIQHIEKELRISLASRGNTIFISGEEKYALIARNILNELYAKLEKGWEITIPEIDASIRAAKESATETQAVAKQANMLEGVPGYEYAIKTPKKIVRPYTRSQGSYIKQLEQNELVFSIGPAGTGKTYIAVAMAVAMFTARKVERIILSRPAVEAGEKLGFLPGNLKEKIDPYLRPLYDALYDLMPAERVVRLMETGEIELAPLAFMRGRTLANSYVILDEAQNTTPMQMKMFLTRLGENSRMVITGDLTQVDLPPQTRSGLRDAIDILSDVEGIAFTRFKDDDILRHPLAAKIVKAYDSKYEARENNGTPGS